MVTVPSTFPIVDFTEPEVICFPYSQTSLLTYTQKTKLNQRPQITIEPKDEEKIETWIEK